jgi:two-component system NtrC family sensor kinase
MRIRSGTTRRLFIAFALLVSGFGAATYAAMAGLAEVHASLHSVKEHEAGVRTALALASAVRDQYAHQAHTIILGNETHLGFYQVARERVVRLLDEVREQVEATDERAWVDEMARVSTEIDRIFRSAIVPAVLRGDRATLLSEHARAQDLVSLIQDRADQLTSRFESRIGGFEQHASAVEHATIRWTLTLMVGATLLAIAIGLYIGRSVARPVAILEAGAARLALGELDARIHIQAPAEFARLAAQWNAMTESLREHQARLVETEKLAGIGRLAAGVAHEINNPLGVILGYVRVLLRRADGALAEDLRIIEDEARRCQQIVEGLLALSHSIRLTPSSVDLRELCDEVAIRLQESVQRPAGSLRVEGVAVVEGDAQRLRQVVFNLLKNALEAAPQGTVEVRIAEDALGVAVSVTDSGPGIRPEDRARLFEPFFTTRPSGTGLGLAVSQAIARAHGGRIEVDAPPAGGARFTLRLPRAGQETV